MNMKKLYRAAAACLIGCLVLAGAFQYRTRRLQEGIAGRILRFHVMAESDAQEDQDLKLKVRDKIGSYLGQQLAGIKDLEECEQAVSGRLAEIEDCAKEVIAKEGYSYAVKASLESTDFPKKTYGDYTFPKGRYRALNVAIGSGKGQNWWCVMYPNLCFSNSVYEAAGENSEKELRAVLTEEEYAEIMAEGKLKVKFKYLEGLLSLFRSE